MTQHLDLMQHNEQVGWIKQQQERKKKRIAIAGAIGSIISQTTNQECEKMKRTIQKNFQVLIINGVCSIIIL